MVIRIRKQSENSFTKNVSFMFVVYWGILVLWQNVSGAETRGSMDLVIKMGLLAYFTGFYLLRAKTLNSKALLVVMLAFSLLCTAVTEGQMPLGTVIAYIYPILVLFLVYGLGDGMEINRSHLLAFCNCIICITAYAAIYAVLFRWNKFVGALSLTGAYGNELTSFFVSNLEYGMYLVAAIISCILCLTLSTNLTKARKTLYISAIVLFAINLVLTFSRTTILSLVIFLIVYMAVGRGKVKKWLIASVVAVVLIFLVSPDIRRFVRDIVFKENTMSGRDTLFEQGMQYFKNGSLSKKVFGFGVTQTRAYFATEFDHGSVHNGYLQVLLYYGLVGCGALIIFMLSQVIINLKMIKKERHIGSVLLGLVLGAALIMVTATSIVFNSNIDSFFVTMFFVLVPKYVRNSINAGTFYD